MFASVSSFCGVRSIVGFCILITELIATLVEQPSGKEPFFDVDLHVSLLHHKQVQRGWRVQAENWLMPPLLYCWLCVTSWTSSNCRAVLIGNLQIRYRTGSSRLFSCYKSTGVMLGMNGGARDRDMAKPLERLFGVKGVINRKTPLWPYITPLQCQCSD